MAWPEVSDYLDKLVDLFSASETSWGNLSVAGTSLQTAASTTYPPNSRFAFIFNNDFLNADEVGTNVTHNKPLYSVTATPGDEWIVQNQQRDFYIPGFDSGMGVASEFDSVPSGQFVPNGVTWEGGYAKLRTGDTTGIAVPATVSKQGAVMHVIENDADLRIYKDGEVAASLALDDWKFNPFDSPLFQFDLSKFFVLRIEYDLYGAGDFTFFLKIRRNSGFSELKKLGTVGIVDAPALIEYNLHPSTRVQLASDAASNVTYNIGPIEYHNEVNAALPDRTKGEALFNVDVSTTVTSNDETVIAVYRLQPDKVEVPVQVQQVAAEMASSGNPKEGVVQVRSVHRDFLTFPNGVDPDDASNWLSLGATPTEASYVASPPTSVRESAIEKLDVGENDVTIATFEDDDGETKVRGEEESFVDLTVENQARVESRDIDAEAFMNEFKYLVLLASLSDTSVDYRRIRANTAQLW